MKFVSRITFSSPGVEDRGLTSSASGPTWPQLSTASATWSPRPTLISFCSLCLECPRPQTSHFPINSSLTSGLIEVTTSSRKHLCTSLIKVKFSFSLLPWYPLLGYFQSFTNHTDEPCLIFLLLSALRDSSVSLSLYVASGKYRVLACNTFVG